MKKQFIQVLCGICVFSSLAVLSGCSTLDADDKGGKFRKRPSVVETSNLKTQSQAQDTQVSALDANAEIEGENRQASDDSSGNGTASAMIGAHSQVFHFAFDDTTLQESDKPLLQAQGEYLKAHPKSTILLAGHTDERGSREYNVALGERRAQTVAEYLRLMGVTPSQIRLVSYGQEKPMVVGHNEEAYAQNRRVALDYEATA